MFRLYTHEISTLTLCMLFFVPDLVFLAVTLGECMLFYVPELVSRLQSVPTHRMFSNFPALLQYPCIIGALYVILCSWSCLFGFKPGAMYVILCTRFSLPPLSIHSSTMYAILWPCSSPMPLVYWHNVCYSMFLIYFPGCNPGTMVVAPCSRLRLPSIQSIPTQQMLLYVPALVLPCNTYPMYGIICSWSCLFDYKPGTTDVILCPRIGPPALLSAPAQRVIFYGPALLNPCNTGSMYVIVCSCYCLFGNNPGGMYGFLWSANILPPLQSGPARYMLFYGPALLISCKTGAMYVIVCCWSCLLGYKPGSMYVILCSRISLPPLPIRPSTMYLNLWHCYNLMTCQHWHNLCYSLSLP